MILTVRKSTLKKKPWAMWRAAASPQAPCPQAGAITATTRWPRRCAGAATSAARIGTKNVRLAAAIGVSHAEPSDYCRAPKLAGFPAEHRLARSFEEIAVAFRQHLDRRQITTEKETMNPLDQTDVANLRESIRATVTHLSGETVPEAETALQKHLESPLAQERALFTVCVAVQKLDADTPGAHWYPDDSGKWVEVHPSSCGLPATIADGTKVEVLLAEERQGTAYRFSEDYASSWRWLKTAGRPGQIVAYKIVE